MVIRAKKGDVPSARTRELHNRNMMKISWKSRKVVAITHVCGFLLFSLPFYTFATRSNKYSSALC